MSSNELIALLAACGFVLMHIAGALHALHALMNVRTSQGAIAWIICLIAFPYAAIPFYFLFDEVGPKKLSKSFLEEMTKAGIQCQSFGSNRFWSSRLQINFLNHRKIVVVDGQSSYLGGLPLKFPIFQANRLAGGAWACFHPGPANPGYYG